MKIDNKSDLVIEVWTIEKALQAFWENNPRIISEVELNNLRRSIKEFGTILPPIFNKQTGLLVGGHQRIRAAQLEGLTEVPMIIVDLVDVDADALGLALNKIKGKWDYEKLEDSIKLIAEADILELSGFCEDDLIGIFDFENEDEHHTFNQKETSQKASIVQFKSPDIEFSCLREEYEVLIQSLYDKYGFDDLIIENRFFNIIGIGES
jgi:hypothetical protein